MAWYDPRDWSTDDLKRAGLDVATGGQYETLRALTGNSSIYDKVPGYSEVSGVLKPAEADLSGVKEAQAKAFGLSDALGGERAGYVGQYDPTIGRQAIDNLVAAAAGQVPSPAELQLKEQAARNAANNFGVAAALQGRSPGAALRMATIGSNRALSDANLQAALLRAQEQASARNALTAALSGQRSQDIDESGNLLTGQLSALNSGVNAASAAANASAAAAGAKNQFKGSLLNAGGSLLGKAFG